ncbi:glycosyltransferase family 2 protein [Candidatus Woesebacteria bacterium]|nr:glycosyltransferase family 2 protein [Candidatus Woesebacteria bacterium]
MSQITAIVTTHNAAKTLPECLQSLSFVDEIIVIDMESTDETRAIARKFHTKVLSIPPAEYVELIRNSSITEGTKPWILLVDPDETIPQRLQQKLVSLIDDSRTQISAYKIARKNLVFGAWIKHSGWWPDYQVRFFKRGSVSWSGVIHEQPSVNGAVGVIDASSELAIEHTNYSSLDEYFQRMMRYTQAEAGNKSEKSFSNITSDQLFVAFFSDFFRRYYQDEGFRDGLHGTSLALLQSLYQVTTALRVWEKQQFPYSDTAITDSTIDQVISDWKYWQASKMSLQTSGLKKAYWLLKKKLRF